VNDRLCSARQCLPATNHRLFLRSERRAGRDLSRHYRSFCLGKCFPQPVKRGVRGQAAKGSTLAFFADMVWLLYWKVLYKGAGRVALVRDVIGRRMLLDGKDAEG